MGNLRPIAFLDDDELDLELFKMALKRVEDKIPISISSFKFFQFEKELLHSINQNQFRLIISDLNLRGRSSLEMIEGIRKIDEHYSKIPIIIFSNSSFEQDIEKAKKFQVTDFITKPSRFEDFKQVIIDILNKHLS